MKIKYRVKKHEDFQKVIQAKKSIANNCFVIYYKQNEMGHARVGISTSKKLGNAVVRSRIRRQVRVIAKNEINFENEYDYCIIVRKKYLNNDFQSNKKEFSNLIKKVK
ncbi:MAG: ribonuclease P protein component [Bacillales bacterium]|nr:ribonuclease P protein component [Bacillales bacterium]